MPLSQSNERKLKLRWRKPAALFGLIAGIAALTLLSCAEERGITPSPTKYHATLLTTDKLSNPEHMVRILDLSTGEVAGEVPVDFGGGMPAAFTVSLNGQYCATSNRAGNIKLIDLQSLAVINELNLNPIISSLHFLPVSPLKLFVSCGTRCTSAVYDLSSGAVDAVWPGTQLAFSSPDQRELVAISFDALTRRSYDTWEIVDSFTFVSPIAGHVTVYGAEVLPAYDGIYILGRDLAGDAVFRYNFSDHSCSFRQPLLTNLDFLRRFAVSPDGREIWVLQYETRVSPPPDEPAIETRAYVLIVDGSTGIPLDTIWTVELPQEEELGYAVPLVAIEFHPGEPVVYVATQSRLSLLVIDRTSREIIDSLDVGYVSDIVISPSLNTSAHTR